MKSLHRNVVIVTVMLFAAAGPVFPDGIMRSQTDGYPGELLRHVNSDISVTVVGAITETEVINRFQNEYHLPIDAVYSFPVPAGAEVTGLWYMRNDSFYLAQLKELPQQTNPGTGEGGFIAELNRYLGQYRVNFPLKTVPPGSIQSIKVRYIQRGVYRNGVYRYRFPLSTDKYRTRFLEQVSFSINLLENDGIDSIWSYWYPENMRVTEEGSETTVTIEKSKIPGNEDICFFWRHTGDDYATCSRISIAADDTAAGYVALSLYPSLSEAQPAFSKEVVFVIDNSTPMKGGNLQQTVAAVKACIDQLDPGDTFSLLSVASTARVHYQRIAPVPEQKNSVAATLDSLEKTTGGSACNLAGSLNSALALFPGNELNNMILVFTAGNSVVRPDELENEHMAGIFPLVFGADAARERMEYLAEHQNGFALYLTPDIMSVDEITSFFSSVSVPVVKALQFSWEGGTSSQLLPDYQQYAMYRGSSLLLTGYFEEVPSTLAFGMQGESAEGAFSKTFTLRIDSTEDAASNDVVKRMWAKEKIHALQRELTVNGYTDSLRELIVSYSLAYKVRSKYTSYWEDETVTVPETGGIDDPISTLSHIRPDFSGAMQLHRVKDGIVLSGGSSVLPVTGGVFEVFDIKGRLVMRQQIPVQAGGLLRFAFFWRSGNRNLFSKGCYVAVVRIGGFYRNLPFSLY